MYTNNTSAAVEQLFGRQVDPVSWRGFIGGAGLIVMMRTLGASTSFTKYMSGGLVPVALVQTEENFQLTGKVRAGHN